MSSYYCLVAGLPDVLFDGSKTAFTIDRFREEIYPSLSPADAKCIDLFFLAWDNENLLKLLREGSEVEFARTGCYSKESLLDIISQVKNGDARDEQVPAYLYDFLVCYFESEQGEPRLWPDVLSAYYYAYAMKAQNKFVSAWFTFNLDVNNVLVAMTARKYKMNTADVVIGDNEVADALRTSSARDFGLSGSFEYLEALQRLSENEKLQEREHQLDEIRWAWLEDNSVFNYFTVEKLYVFLQKLDIISRWAKLDSETGMQRYNELIDNLKSGLNL
ncbi:MAG: DUF2764 family protein [Bacteroidaceae bacterium]|nr:DUF2764 family protein [Bacteroidaceae bacterium]